MGNDSELKVKITADSSGVQSGSESGADAFAQACSNIQNSVAGLNGVFATMAGFLTGALSIGAMKGAIDAAIHYNESIVQLSRVMGITTEEASSLAAAIKMVGGTTEEYAAMNMKLDKQVKQNSQTLNQLGVVTRDNNGNLLSQTEIFNNAITAMAKYKAGADQDLFALTVFGRSCTDAYKFQKLTNEVMKDGEKVAKEYGLTVGKDAAENTEKMAKEMRTLGIVSDAAKVQIGNELLPTITGLIAGLSDAGGAMVIITGPVKALVSLFEGLKFVIQELVTLIVGFGTAAKDLFGGLGAAIGKFMSGDIKGAYAAMKGIKSDIDTDMNTMGDQLVNNAQKTSDRLEKIWLGTQKKIKDAGAAKSGDMTMPDIKGNKQELADLEKMVDTKIAMAQRETDEKKHQLDRQYQLGQISAANQIAQELALDQELLKLEQSYFDQYRAIASKLPEQKQQIANKILQIEQKTNLAIKRDQEKLADENIKSWQGFLSPVTKQMTSALSQMLQGTMSFKQGITSIFQSILSSIESKIAQMVADWAAGEAAKLNWSKMFQQLMIAFGIASAEESTAAAETNAAELAVINVGKATSNTAEGATAVAAGAAEVSGVYGLITGPAAAAAYFGIMSPYIAAAAASGGFDIPAGTNPITQLHAQEMVLPAHLAEKVRGMTSGGGSTNISIHALDTKSFMSREGRKVIKGLVRSAQSMGLHR